MPKIEVSYEDLCSLIGKNIPKDELADVLLYAKVELDGFENNMLKLDCKDTNRPDLWSAEGIAREIKARLGKPTLTYKVTKSNFAIKIDKSIKQIRPYNICALIKNVHLSKEALEQHIQLQDKVSSAYGRNRKTIAIGSYDADKIKSPIRCMAVDPYGIKFVPLGFAREMTPVEIMTEHPKGKQFANIFEGHDKYPLLIDSENKVLSIPAIINSELTGKITEKTRNIFIDCSGDNLEMLNTALNVIVAQLADRGGKIESVKIEDVGKTYFTPQFEPKKFIVDAGYLQAVSGMNLSDKEIVKLLTLSNYFVKKKGVKIELLYPAYRNDIMHSRDIAEDIYITYNYNNMDPQKIEFVTLGREDEQETFCDRLADIAVGSGFQEILSYTLTNRDNLFSKMNLENQDAAEIENPASANWSVFRTSLMPGLLEFFSMNKHVEYPQKIFEIGNCIFLSGGETKSKDVKHLALGISDSTVNYEIIASNVDAILRNLGLKYQLKKISHPSFIEGRCAEILINSKRYGLVGEVHPSVLNNWNLEKPVVIAELNATELFYSMV